MSVISKLSEMSKASGMGVKLWVCVGETETLNPNLKP